MSGKLLLFGFDSLLHVLALEAAVGPFGAEIVPVARMDYNKTLAVLAGLDADVAPVMSYSGGPLGGRMIVFCELEDRLDALLPALRKAEAGPECLKAVLTPSNRNWSALKLYGELQREHQALGGR